MCGRFALSAKTKDIEKLVDGIKISTDLLPRYNIAPSQSIAAVLNMPERQLDYVRWGLVPGWAKDASIGNRMINARGETLLEKPAFKASFLRKRCIIPASGFYEWQKSASGKSKQPFFIRLRNASPFAFAGIWDRWTSPDGEPVVSAAIVTTSPNPLVERIHNRMPVILDEPSIQTWLRYDSVPVGELMGCIKPFPDEFIEAYTVSSLVNNPGNDFAECLEPANVI